MLDRHEVQGFGYALLQRSSGADLEGFVLAPARVGPRSRGRLGSADLLGQRDDDARVAAKVATQEDALEPRYLAEDFAP